MTKTLLKLSIIFSILIASQVAFAAGQCGPFLISAGPDDGFMRINGIKPVSQKVTFLKQKDDYDNIKMQWMLPRNDYPGFYGMDYIKSNGKAILNVEAVRSNMDEPRLFGTYDCVKVK